MDAPAFLAGAAGPAPLQSGGQPPGVRKENVVLEVDVLVQLGFQLGQPRQQDPVGVAAVRRGSMARCQLPHPRQRRARAVMLLLKVEEPFLERAGRRGERQRLRQLGAGWEAALFLIPHVVLQLRAERLERSLEGVELRVAYPVLPRQHSAPALRSPVPGAVRHP
jgi:hypothetical protein